MFLSKKSSHRDSFKISGAASSEKCVVYFGGCDWNDTPSRQKYLMEAISHYCNVYFLDDGFDVRGRVSWKRVSDGVTVIRGLTKILSLFDRFCLGWVKTFYAKWALWLIRRRYNVMILWVAENERRFYRYLPHDVYVYDLIDPCFSDNESIIANYHSLIEENMGAADVVFATAESLKDACQRLHTNVILLNNACEPREYSEQLIAAAQKPSWWPNTQNPIGAYLGSIDWRFDVRAVVEACEQNPYVHFIIAGKILPFAVHEPSLRELLAKPNVTAPGRISLEDGRYLLAHCTFGMIPFVAGTMNDAVNPVKMYTYSLMGKPVLGTAIRELTSRIEIVQIGLDSLDFGRRVMDVVSLSKDSSHQAKLRQFALYNTWADRALSAWKVLQEL